MGRGGRAAVPALHLRRGAPGARRRRGVGQHRARRSRPHGRRRAARHGAASTCSRPSRRDGCDPCEHAGPEPIPIRFRPTLANAPVTQARPSPAPVAESPMTPTLAADLVSLTFSPLLHDFLEQHGFAFRAGPAVVRGGDGAWSVSDGVTVALLRVDGGTLQVLSRPDVRDRDDRRGPARRAAGRRARGHAARRDGAVAAGARPARQRRRRRALRRRGRARRLGDAALRRRRARPRPETDTEFSATYRVGNGAAGNVGAGLDRARRDAERRDPRRDEPARRGGRHRPRAGGRGAARRARGVPRPGARGHGGRLRAR